MMEINNCHSHLCLPAFHTLAIPMSVGVMHLSRNVMVTYCLVFVTVYVYVIS